MTIALTAREAQRGGSTARKAQRAVVFAALFAIATAIVCACSPTTPSAVQASGPAASAGGAVLRLGGADPQSLNPIFSFAIGQNNLLRLMFEPLVASDPDGNLVPALAAVVPTRENGGISADGLTITYHLRHDVRWHDGVPVTSRDIAYSTRAMLDPTNAIISRRGYDQIVRIMTPDAYTVRVRLRTRFAPFVASYFSESDYPIYPVPAHLLEGSANLERAPFSSAPVGDGPFRFVRWQRGDRVEMTANPLYFRGAPSIARLDWHIITDENTEIAQLRSGELDMVMDMTPTAAAQLTGASNVHVVASAVNGYRGLMFNTRRVRDVRIRRAIAEAIDFNAVRAQISHGTDRPAIADLPAFLWAYDRRLTPLAYRPDEARRLVRAAGYGPDKPYPLDFAIISGRRTDEALAVLLQATLARIGIAVHIRGYAATLYGETAGNGGVIAGGRYDATIYHWIAGTDPDDSSQFLCNQIPPAGNNVSFYCNAEMDAAQTTALTSYDRPTRKRAYSQIERLLLRDVPIVFLGSPTVLTALRSGVGGFAPNPVTPSVRADRWTLTPHER